MKYLSDYTKEGMSKLFDELGVFFAFNTQQFEEGVLKHAHKKPEGTKWASMGSGMYMPSVNVAEFDKRYDVVEAEAIKQDLAENGREGVLQRELGNYEIGLSYSGHKDPNFRGGISGYGFTEEEIVEQYNKHMQEHEY